MKIHQLHYFWAAAETGSFDAGALREHVPQTSLAQDIRRLEEELGTELFHAGPKTKLTESGTNLFSVVQSILSQIAEPKDQARGRTSVGERSVTVGALPSIAPYLLPEAVSDFQRKYPRVRVSIVEEMPKRLLDAVRNTVVDIGVTQLPVSGEEFVTEKLLREPLYAAVPAEHRLAGRKTIDLRELKDDFFILPKDELALRGVVHNMLKRAKVHPDIVLEALSVATVLAMVSSGLGVSLVPEMALNKRKGCKFIPLRNILSKRTLGLVRLKGRQLGVPKLLFVEYLKQTLRVSPQR
jgi:LysR family hydrogen peroxide-inducible transcriptional activator